MASPTFAVQNIFFFLTPYLPSFFPIIQPRTISRFDSLELNAYLPSRHLRSVPEEEYLEAESPTGDNPTKMKKKKKKGHRPNFCHQTLKKWSLKISSQRTNFPWQQKGAVEKKSSFHCPPATGLPSKPSANRRGLAFMDRREKLRSSELDPEVDSTELVGKLHRSCNHSTPRNSQDGLTNSTSQAEVDCITFGVRLLPVPCGEGVESRRSILEQNNLFLDRDPGLIDSSNEEERIPKGRTIPSSFLERKLKMQKLSANLLGNAVKNTMKSHFDAEEPSSIHSQTHKSDAESLKSSVSVIIKKLEESMDQHIPEDATGTSYGGSHHERILTDSLVDSLRSSVSFPWEKQKGISNIDLLQNKSNTKMAERTIPEPELRRLRNEALRMKDRMRVGPAGVTEAVVESIHQKWNEAEVVKLHIEGPPNLNMKRTHEILETKTGGTVIWRSGSSLVLYRGLTYKLPCARSFLNLSDNVSSMNDLADSDNFNMIKVKGKLLEESDADTELSCATTFEGSWDASDIESLLSQLGPRYKDWSGGHPLPVDADLLPGIVPGYKTPFRLLPYKTRKTLTNKQMTFLRRIARSMAPHFALGRNKQLQGLANAIVKLWETSAIAKIAIKRGVQNTSNERMTEEIKELTGGTVLSRNKEYIIFYRGNDFLSPSIRQTLVEREKLTTVRLDAEEDARLRASDLIHSNFNAARVPFVAGTLAETLEAYNHWSNQPISEDREKMRRDLVLSQHVSLIRYLERKMSFAIAKAWKADKALAKVQKSQQLSKLPTDLETVTNEERMLFRKIGLKMRPCLPLGRRGIFDGTIQNIHLNWKHMELAKIIVKEKSFPQVKHISISLEAESGGVLISVDKTTKGYAIILYRGKNYQQPNILRPKNLLSKREALACSVELQRREALNHHIENLHEKIHTLKSQLAQKTQMEVKQAVKIQT